MNKAAMLASLLFGSMTYNHRQLLSTLDEEQQVAIIKYLILLHESDRQLRQDLQEMIEDDLPLETRTVQANIVRQAGEILPFDSE